MNHKSMVIFENVDFETQFKTFAFIENSCFVLEKFKIFYFKLFYQS